MSYKFARQTPAHYAAKKGHVDILKLLIEVGQADINATDRVSHITVTYDRSF